MLAGHDLRCRGPLLTTSSTSSSSGEFHWRDHQALPFRGQSSESSSFAVYLLKTRLLRFTGRLKFSQPVGAGKYTSYSDYQKSEEENQRSYGLEHSGAKNKSNYDPGQDRTVSRIDIQCDTFGCLLWSFKKDYSKKQEDQERDDEIEKNLLQKIVGCHDSEKPMKQSVCNMRKRLLKYL